MAHCQLAPHPRIERERRFLLRELPPGLDPGANGADDYAIEVFTFLDLKAGIYRFGVRSDDGYKIASGIQPVTASTHPVGHWSHRAEVSA